VGNCNSRALTHNSIPISGFSIIPNPSSGDFTIRGNALKNGLYTIELRNAVGVLLHHSVIENTAESLNYQMSMHEKLTGGLYWLRTFGNNGQLVKIVLVD
jgi:hypothetical protein